MTKFRTRVTRIPVYLEPAHWGPTFDSIDDGIAHQLEQMADAAEDYHFTVVELLPGGKPDRVMWARGAKSWGAPQVDPSDWD
jgi:hypothetical protein